MSRDILIKELKIKAKEINLLSEKIGEETEVGQRLNVLENDIEGAIRDIEELTQDKYRLKLDYSALYLTYSEKYKKYRITELDDAVGYNSIFTEDEIDYLMGDFSDGFAAILEKELVEGVK